MSLNHSIGLLSGIAVTSDPRKTYSAVTMIAAGNTILIFTLNLSAMEHSCVLVAAIVVSEMNERLSPKNEPPTIMAVMKASSGAEPEAICWAIPAPTGTRATMVPTLVPMDMEMKQEAMKSPAYISFPGRICRAMLTVASIAPISLAVAAKAPARTNIHIISITLLFPAPLENVSIFFSRLLSLVMSIAYTDATRNAADIGIL